MSGHRFGIAPATAVEQLQHDQSAFASQAFEPLLAPTGSAPYRLALASVLGSEPDPLVLHVIGDHGGVKDPEPQQAVAKALIADHAEHPVTACYSVGDVVYFNGAEAEYPPQFGEPYSHYNVPIFAIPGNHDGDPETGASLEGFVRHFCDTEPQLLPNMAEYQRTTMVQPNVYWTLTSAQATIIGLYSNVPAGGVVKPNQAEWLTSELAQAPKDRALIVSLHHPPLSCDAHHGGSQKMGDILDAAFGSSGRTPDLVLSGHVHNYQRFSRSYGDHKVPYLVCGASGYHNLHRMATGAQPGLRVTPETTLEAFEDGCWGFLRLTVDASQIAGEYTAVAKDGSVTPAVDQFTVPLNA